MNFKRHSCGVTSLTLTPEQGCVTRTVSGSHRVCPHWALAGKGLRLALRTCEPVSLLHLRREVNAHSLLLRTRRCLKPKNLTRLENAKEVVRPGCWLGSARATSSDTGTPKSTSDQPSVHGSQQDLKRQAST